MSFNVENQKINTAIKTQISGLEKDCYPQASLVEIRLLFLDEANLEEQEESEGLKLVLKECLGCFSALALDLLQEDGPRQEELKVLKDPAFFLKMILNEGKSRILLDPNTSLVKLNDQESSFKLCE